MGKDPIFSFRIQKRHWIRDYSEGPEKMALESVLFIKILVIKILYLHQIESQAQHADSCIAWSCRPSNEFTARPNEHLVEEVDWKRNDTKKTFRYRKAKKNFIFICERIADQKRIFCNIIVIGKFSWSCWGGFALQNRILLQYQHLLSSQFYLPAHDVNTQTLRPFSPLLRENVYLLKPNSDR